MEEKPDENLQNGELFDREAYLKTVEEFDDVEIVVPGRSQTSRVNRKHVRNDAFFICFICLLSGSGAALLQRKFAVVIFIGPF